MSFKDPEKQRAAQLKWKAAHPGRANELARKYRAEKRDKINEMARASALKLYRANPDKFRDKAKKWREENPEKWRRARRQSIAKHRGHAPLTLTKEEENSMFVAQSGACAICSVDDQTLVPDHCHETGKVRGLLCHKCNRALGAFGDKLTIVMKAAEYLAIHN